MKSRIFADAGLLLGVAIAAGCSDARPTAPTTPFVVDGRIPVFAASTTPKYIIPAGKGLDVATDPSPPPRTRNRIDFHGGPLLDARNVYYIWYGNWPNGDPDIFTFQSVVLDLASNFCQRPYTDMLKAYPDRDGRVPGACLSYSGSSMDAYSHGPTLSDADVADIVYTQVATGQLPYDPYGMYMVMASPDIAESSGFGSTYCGWHGRVDWYDLPLRFGFVGGPARAPARCAPNGPGPNGSASADAAASHLAALWSNIITDPNDDGWFDKLGLEIADKCVWTYGTTYTAPNGASANVHLGNRDYLLQQLWVPSKSGGACALHP
jgi:hypothetical protein